LSYITLSLAYDFIRDSIYILTENQTVFSVFSPTFVLATVLPGLPNYYTPVYKGCEWDFSIFFSDPTGLAFGVTNPINNLTDVNESHENETNATEIGIEAYVTPVNTTIQPAPP
jgi:hypothetical protein